MLSQCNRLFLCLLLPLWCALAQANTSLNEDEFDLSERAWLSSHRELSIGMPIMGDPPTAIKMLLNALPDRYRTLRSRSPENSA